MPLLSVNIDHVATLRQARYRAPAGASPNPQHDHGEPDLPRAFHEAELGGADGITVHLREDRRHVTDRDVHLLRPLVRVRFNLEMAATDEMIAIAAKVRPHSAMLVPEGRNEVTTEGGLDVASQQPRMKDVVKRLRDAGALVSAFIDADVRQVDAARACGFDICEIHTGPYAHACLEQGRAGAIAVDRELQRVEHAIQAVQYTGMQPNAGHALNYTNVRAIAAISGVRELHIGHAIISRAIYVGLRRATREMTIAMQPAAPPAPQEHP
jgi:pyridoxine 5-phosphate synthase